MFNLFFAFVVVAHGAVEVAVRKPVLHVRHRQRTHRIADQIRLLAPPPHVRIRPTIRATVPHIEVAVLLDRCEWSYEIPDARAAVWGYAGTLANTKQPNENVFNTI